MEESKTIKEQKKIIKENEKTIEDQTLKMASLKLKRKMEIKNFRKTFENEADKNCRQGHEEEASTRQGQGEEGQGEEEQREGQREEGQR